MPLADENTGLPKVALTGFGLVCAIGHDTESSAASVESGLSGMQAISIPDRGGNALIGCPAIEVGVRHLYAHRLRDLCMIAAKEAFDQAHLLPGTTPRRKYHVFWTLPAVSRVGYRLQTQGDHLTGFVQALGLPGDVAAYDVSLGNAGGVAAMIMARSIIANDDRAICLIGGADTLIQLRVLRWLERDRRLKTELWPDGLIPGEAAAFLVVESPESARQRDARPLCHIDRLAYQAVEAHGEPVDNARAERLTKALRMALPPDDTSRKMIARLYCDLNGESLRALEWGLASVRVMDALGLAPEIVHPADCLGDVGAVSAVVNIGLAALWMRESEPGSRFMLFAASETGERAALTALRTADCPSPQIRQNASAPDDYRRLLSQNFEELSFLWSLRRGRLSAPDLRLRELTLIDQRLRAHARALLLAGDPGRQAATWPGGSAAPRDVGAGEIFSATVLAIEDRNSRELDKLLALAESLAELRAGLISGFGWALSPWLQDTIRDLLVSRSPFQRQVGIAACSMHQLDPGAALDAAVTNADVSLRARGLRVAGECGRRDLLARCVSALADEDETCRFRAACSAVLLGERNDGIEALEGIALLAGPSRALALRLVLKVIDAPHVSRLFGALADDPLSIGLLVHGAGVAGDPYYVPWLIKQMENMKLSRLAGESFSFITGLDLASLDLDRKPPEALEARPNDNADDGDVAMDEDDGLPWPDALKIQAWWGSNKSRFSEGNRYFMGRLVTRQHCIHILKEACQRQRIAAAQYLCLLDPGTELFPTSAPVWRQQKILAQMGDDARHQ